MGIFNAHFFWCMVTLGLSLSVILIILKIMSFNFGRPEGELKQWRKGEFSPTGEPGQPVYGSRQEAKVAEAKREQEVAVEQARLNAHQK